MRPSIAVCIATISSLASKPSAVKLGEFEPNVAAAEHN
jgi:hypothetical protein